VRPSYWIQLRNYQGGLIWDRRMLDTLAPGHFGTCVRHFGTKTNRHPDNSYSAPQLDKSAPQKDNSALVFFSLILRTKLPNFNHVCSGKDPYSVLPPMTTITLECFLPRADNTVTLYTTVVWHCEVFLPHPFDHVSGLIKIKSSDQMFTACICIGDCLIFKHIMKRKLLCMDFYCF
jgi:hypothetical protein